LSWVLRALNVRDEDVIKPRIQIVSLRELNGEECEYQLSAHCDVRFVFDYVNNTIYIAETIKYGESVEANAEIVEAMVIFILSNKINKNDTTAATELAITREALSLSKRSKKELIRYLVI